MAYKSVFLKKCSYIKANYGIEAVEHFKKYPYCQRCPEKRLACLTIHHMHGKKVKKFKTLCFNDHVLGHAHKAGEATYESELAWVMKQKERKIEKRGRDKKIIRLTEIGKSLREIADELGISHVAVWRVTKKNGIVSGRKN